MSLTRSRVPIRISMGLIALLLSAHIHAGAGVVATYQFQGTLAADEAGAPALTALNSGSFVTDTNVLGQTRTVYERMSASSDPTLQSALRLDTSSLSLTSNNYAVEVVFTFTDTLDPRAPGTNFRRIINSHDSSSAEDSGLYLGSRGGPSLLDIYQGGSHAGGPDLVNNPYYDLVLSVSPTGEQAYVNGVLAVGYSGLPDAIASNFLNFFLDNEGSSAYEYGNGKVALIRVFNSALTAEDVRLLNNDGDPFPAASVPEPSSVVLLGLGAFGLAGMMRHRRRAS